MRCPLLIQGDYHMETMLPQHINRLRLTAPLLVISLLTATFPAYSAKWLKFTVTGRVTSNPCTAFNASTSRIDLSTIKISEWKKTSTSLANFSFSSTCDSLRANSVYITFTGQATPEGYLTVGKGEGNALRIRDTTNNIDVAINKSRHKVSFGLASKTDFSVYPFYDTSGGAEPRPGTLNGVLTYTMNWE